MQLAGRFRRQQGDTIIEVIFAIVIFSSVAISSIAIMNKGIATGERALETTLVRQEINAQAEALRFIHEASVVSSSEYGDRWAGFMSTASGNGRYGQSRASSFGTNEDGECVIPTGSGYRPFVMNTRMATVWAGTPSVESSTNASTSENGLPPYAQVAYSKSDARVVQDAYGIWVESVPSALVVSRRFVDFHIRACWPAPDGAIPITIGTIVRLYDPS